MHFAGFAIGKFPGSRYSRWGMPALTREQFIEEILKVVPQKFPLVKLARGEEVFSLRVNGSTVLIEDLYRRSLLQPNGIRQHIERWVVELLRAAEGSPDRMGPFEALKDRILPVVLSDQRADSVHRQTMTEPLVCGLRVGYAVDSDHSMTYVPRALFETWKISSDELHETAITNLVARSEAMAAQAAQDDEGRVNLILFQAGDGYDASRILLPTLHDRLREHLGSPFIAAIPNRDILLCFRDDDETVARVGFASSRGLFEDAASGDGEAFPDYAGWDCAEVAMAAGHSRRALHPRPEWPDVRFRSRWRA